MNETLKDLMDKNVLLELEFHGTSNQVIIEGIVGPLQVNYKIDDPQSVKQVMEQAALLLKNLGSFAMSNTPRIDQIPVSVQSEKVQPPAKLTDHITNEPAHGAITPNKNAEVEISLPAKRTRPAPAKPKVEPTPTADTQEETEDSDGF